MTWQMQKIMARTIRKSLTVNIFLPQHRERIVLVGFRRDLNLKADFTLREISKCFPAQRVTLAQLLDPMVEAKYILTPVLWKYLYRYAKTSGAR